MTHFRKTAAALKRVVALPPAPAAALFLLWSSVSLSGCALLLIGAGAAGGYAISRDSVISQHDLAQDHVYRQALAVVHEMGVVQLEDARHGKIQATVQEAQVRISVKPLTRKTVELRVKARKNLLPAVSVAQDVYNKIAQRL